MARRRQPARDRTSGRFHSANAEHAQRLEAAIAAFRSAMPNEFELISRRPLSDGVPRMISFLRRMR
jgi:hypothetical protein